MKASRKDMIDQVNNAARLHGELTLKYERCEHRTVELASKYNGSYKQSVSSYRAENTHIRAIPPPAYYGEEIVDAQLETDPAVFVNIRFALTELAAEHAEVEPYVPTLHDEIAQLSDLRAELENTVSETIKAWGAEAIGEYEHENDYHGPRDPVFVKTIRSDDADLPAERTTSGGTRTRA